MKCLLDWQNLLFGHQASQRPHKAHFTPNEIMEQSPRAIPCKTHYSSLAWLCSERGLIVARHPIGFKLIPSTCASTGWYSGGQIRLPTILLVRIFFLIQPPHMGLVPGPLSLEKKTHTHIPTSQACPPQLPFPEPEK